MGPETNADVLMHFVFDPAAEKFLCSRCRNASGDTVACALKAALYAHKLDAVQLLVSKADERGHSKWKRDEELLLFAIFTGQVPIVQLLLTHNVAPRYKSLVLFPYLDKTVPVLEYFLDLGVTLPDLLDQEIQDHPDNSSYCPNLPPFAHAAARGLVEVLRVLIRRGVHKKEAQVWAVRAGKRRHAIHLAARGEDGNNLGPNGDCLACIRELLDLGIHPDIRDHKLRSPLHYAAKRDLPDIVSMLIDAGASPVRDARGRTPLDVLPKAGEPESASVLRSLCTLVKIL